MQTKRIGWLCALGLSLLAGRAFADDYTLDGKASALSYHLVHKLHTIDGTSHAVQGKAVVAADGKLQAMVRAPVESFDSANVNRDAHMKETVEAAQYPTVEIKALGEGFAAPTVFPTTLRKTVKVQLSFHGQKQLFDVPIELTYESASRVKATTSFNISLDAYKIERPSLMFVKVEDALKISAQLIFNK
jgi:hypothetical protein